MSANAARTGVIPVPKPSSEQLLGGHAILAVGYDDAKKAIIFKNSWNTTWGDHGYGYFPYGYFQVKDSDGQVAVADAWQAN